MLKGLGHFTKDIFLEGGNKSYAGKKFDAGLRYVVPRDTKNNPAGNSGVLVLNPLKNYYSLLFAGLAAF
jgi:hypothetical protein